MTDTKGNTIDHQAMDSEQQEPQESVAVPGECDQSLFRSAMGKIRNWRKQNGEWAEDYPFDNR